MYAQREGCRASHSSPAGTAATSRISMASSEGVLMFHSRRSLFIHFAVLPKSSPFGRLSTNATPTSSSMATTTTMNASPRKLPMVLRTPPAAFANLSPAPAEKASGPLARFVQTAKRAMPMPSACSSSRFATRATTGNSSRRRERRSRTRVAETAAEQAGGLSPSHVHKTLSHFS